MVIVKVFMCIFFQFTSSLMCRGLEAVKRSERVYLEAYTSLLLVPKETLVSCYCAEENTKEPITPPAKISSS